MFRADLDISCRYGLLVPSQGKTIAGCRLRGPAGERFGAFAGVDGPSRREDSRLQVVHHVHGATLKYLMLITPVGPVVERTPHSPIV